MSLDVLGTFPEGFSLLTVPVLVYGGGEVEGVAAGLGPRPGPRRGEGGDLGRGSALTLPLSLSEWHWSPLNRVKYDNRQIIPKICSEQSSALIDPARSLILRHLAIQVAVSFPCISQAI